MMAMASRLVSLFVTIVAPLSARLGLRRIPPERCWESVAGESKGHGGRLRQMGRAAADRPGDDVFVVDLALQTTFVGRQLAAEAAQRHATHPGWASTPGLDASLPRFAAALRPVLRSDAVGTDTTTWLVATEPAPASGQLWHDRRARRTSVLRRTRPTETERATFWEWVAGSTGLKD